MNVRHEITSNTLIIMAFILLYKALVRPHIKYGNTIWYPFLRKDIESVERIQKRATKLIPELTDLTYTERLKRLKLPSLAHRRKRGVAKVRKEGSFRERKVPFAKGRF